MCNHVWFGNGTLIAVLKRGWTITEKTVIYTNKSFRYYGNASESVLPIDQTVQRHVNRTIRGILEWHNTKISFMSLYCRKDV